MTVVKRVMQIGGAIGAMALLAYCQAALGPGGSVVMEADTNRPLPGAQVTLDCETSRGLEGSEVLRRVTRTTDAQGRYYFDRGDVFGCLFGSLHVEKEGYVNLSPGEIVYKNAGGLGLAMIRAERATLHRLSLSASSMQWHVEAVRKPGARLAYEYSRAHEQFLTARELAQSPEERAYVAANICGPLLQVQASLTPQDLAALAGEPKQWTGKVFLPVDPPAAEAWCQAARQSP
ncbi:hypothetical protein [Ramlibacter humi]|uniref:Carboxypeptidase regulatory-like domain-containing protein n=1 Tax=Ramlibacter humi TaxID=2530451 RepID=A0A4Z0BR78_9BURK|nr:hypothetical protein [Ramlibacter humi]TFZ01817.1 hypothetical protein EZ216_11535 [Ramlibacter humi]